MKRFLILAAVAVIFSSSSFAADVGVSVSIGQPGFYGRIDIGGYPEPQLVYRRPMVIEPVPMGRPPIYLRVPPGHAKHWSKHCREYNACGEKVYFVQDGWYNHEFSPRYQKQHGDYRDERRDERSGDRHSNQNNDRHDNGRGRNH